MLAPENHQDFALEGFALAQQVRWLK